MEKPCGHAADHWSYSSPTSIDSTLSSIVTCFTACSTLSLRKTSPPRPSTEQPPGRGGFRKAPGTRAWLLRTATNLANTHYRKKRLYRFLRADLAKARPTVGERPADSRADQNENSAHVRAALMALRPKYQAVVVLRYYTQLSVREISEVLGCRQDAVRTRLSCALKNMRGELGIDQSNQDTSSA